MRLVQLGLLRAARRGPPCPFLPVPGDARRSCRRRAGICGSGGSRCRRSARCRRRRCTGASARSASPCGRRRRRRVAPALPVPATVRILPVRVDDAQGVAARAPGCRRCPAPSTATARGSTSGALRARRRPRARPSAPLPATVRDDARLQVDGADAAVVEVGEVQPLALGVEGEAVDAAELGLGRRPAVAAEALRAGAGERW